MAADDFELRLAQSARSLVAEPVSVDVVRAAAAFSARTAVKPRTRAKGQLIGIFVVVVAVMLAALAISPGSPLRRLLVATMASPSPTINSSSPAPASMASPDSTPAPSVLNSPSPSRTAGPDASDQAAHLLAFTPLADGEPIVSIANEDGTNPHVIFSGGFMSWSPSGRYVLATAGEREVVLDTTGTVIGSLPFGSVDWSPDDHLLVSARLGNGAPTSKMALYDVGGSLVRSYPIPDGVDQFAGASWAPNGTSFVTAGCKGCSLDAPNGGWGLWIMAADGSGATKILDAPRPVSGVTWSPDGTSISYSTSCLTAHEQCGDADYGGWLIAPDGSNPRLFLRHGGSPLWSPDGSHLLYSQGETQSESLFVSLPDGIAPIQLTHEPGLDGSPSWISPDRIGYFHRGPTAFHGTVMATRSDGTQPEPDTVGTDWTSFGWQP